MTANTIIIDRVKDGMSEMAGVAKIVGGAKEEDLDQFFKEQAAVKKTK
jgi:hypothetical protein